MMILSVGYVGRIIAAWHIGSSVCCIGSPSNQSIIGHFIKRGMGCLARGNGRGKPNGCIPCCLERLDICRVGAPVILIPHVLEAVIAIPIHVKTNFLKKIVKNFPCSHSRFSQEGATLSAGVSHIHVVVACNAGEAFGDRCGKKVRYPVCLNINHFLEPVQ